MDPTRQITEKELKERGRAVQKVLNKLFPDATTALSYKTPFQLLVATILSAQCTDVLVNKVTAKLFKKYPAPKDFCKVSLPTLTKDVYPVTFYRNKANAIKKTSVILLREHRGRVPKTLEEITALPGAARKTANVVLGHAYGIASGIVVDTHVRRTATRLGLTKNTNPVKIEQDLIKIIPKKNWIKFSDQLILFGREYCTARRDKCSDAGINLKHY